jgi:hypothetical protein
MYAGQAQVVGKVGLSHKTFRVLFGPLWKPLMKEKDL